MTTHNDNLIIVPVPALLAVLLNLENKKGSPLTRLEVLAARDNAESIVMPKAAYDQVVAARGYDDIEPEHAWEQWCAVKETPGLEEQ